MPTSTARKGITKAQLKAALKSAAGIPAIAAEKIGTSRQNVCQRIAKSPELQAWIIEIEQTITDQAQAVTVSGMQEVDPATKKPTKEAGRIARWWLERKGRDRGFSTRMELGNPDGSPLAPGPAVHFHVSYVGPSPEGGEDVV